MKPAVGGYLQPDLGHVSDHQYTRRRRLWKGVQGQMLEIADFEQRGQGSHAYYEDEEETHEKYDWVQNGQPNFKLELDEGTHQ